MISKVEKLQMVLNEYLPFMKVWKQVEVNSTDVEGIIVFSSPKGKNGYISLTKQFPIEDFDKVIARYQSKVVTLKSK